MKQTNFVGYFKKPLSLFSYASMFIFLSGAFVVTSCGDIASVDTPTTNTSNEKTAGLDSAKIKELQKDFRIEKDDFSNDDIKWYRPKASPKFANKNGIYCYFATQNDKLTKLKFRVQYYNDDWLFFDKIQFLVDGKAFDYIPSKTNTDSGNGGYIWEWLDEDLTDADKELIYALSNAKEAKMKFIGKYSDVKIITKEQAKGIKQTLELYNTMGGKY